MTRTVSLFQFMPYGAPDLQSVARPYMVRALLASSLLCILMFAAAAALLPMLARTQPEARPGVTVIVDPTPPPPLPRLELPRVVTPAASHPAEGIAVPVPDEVAPKVTFASQDEMRGLAPSADAAPGAIVVAPAEVEPLPGKDDYVYVDQLPAPVRQVQPEYSGLARDAGAEGRVLVRALVGRNGNVLEAVVDPKYSVPLLDELAVAAVREWKFTPALVNNHPVAVWVAVPFDFKLH